MEQTLLLLKPDAVQRRLVGEIVGRLEKKGLQLAGMKMMSVSKDLAEHHYGVHKGKAFYDSLITYITSSPIIAIVVQGKKNIQNRNVGRLIAVLGGSSLIIDTLNDANLTGNSK